MIARADAARAEIVSGALRGEALLDLLLAVPLLDRDRFVDVLLGFDERLPDDSDLPRGAVPYLPCGVEEILAFVREVPLRPSDVLVDLGAGLGRVLILAHLISGARARGVEIQAPFVTRAGARATALGLAGVTFVHANAADVDVDGSVYFMYSPFNGEMMRAVLGRLEAVAKRHPIVVGAVDVELDAPWLSRRSSSSAKLAIYDAPVSP